MNRTTIETFDFSWNPVTGCRLGCEYCYARKIAERFTPKRPLGNDCTQPGGGLHEIRYQAWGQAYRYGFAPTLHSHRLILPSGLHRRQPPVWGKTLDERTRKNWPEDHIQDPLKIFVCDMGDLFGSWVPEDWIRRVMKYAAGFPIHDFYFLTKNPQRSLPFTVYGADNLHLGTTIDRAGTAAARSGAPHVTWLSIEPLLEDVAGHINWERIKWVIIGPQTKPTIQPDPMWVGKIVRDAESMGIPVFMKDDLKAIYDKDKGRLKQFPKREDA